MVALLVMTLFMGFIFFELVTPHGVRARSTAIVHAGIARFPVPEAGSFLTKNHLLAFIRESGVVRLGPDQLLDDAMGVEAKWIPSVKGDFMSRGDALFHVICGSHVIDVAAPFDGEIVEAGDRYAILKPISLTKAVDGMRVGEAVRSFWERELVRIEEFIAGASPLAHVMADGGELVPGWLAHLNRADVERFQREFLMRNEN